MTLLVEAAPAAGAKDIYERPRAAADPTDAWKLLAEDEPFEDPPDANPTQYRPSPRSSRQGGRRRRLAALLSPSRPMLAALDGPALAQGTDSFFRAGRRPQTREVVPLPLENPELISGSCRRAPSAVRSPISETRQQRGAVTELSRASCSMLPRRHRHGQSRRATVKLVESFRPTKLGALHKRASGRLVYGEDEKDPETSASVTPRTFRVLGPGSLRPAHRQIGRPTEQIRLQLGGAVPMDLLNSRGQIRPAPGPFAVAQGGGRRRAGPAGGRPGRGRGDGPSVSRPRPPRSRNNDNLPPACRDLIKPIHQLLSTFSRQARPDRHPRLGRRRRRDLRRRGRGAADRGGRQRAGMRQLDLLRPAEGEPRNTPRWTGARIPLSSDAASRYEGARSGAVGAPRSRTSGGS